jgi:phage-related protein
MTDNAAKMGTPIESVQQAYQGFAKGQYQLLDNLKLGYGKLYCRIKSRLTALLAGVRTNVCYAC